MQSKRPQSEYIQAFDLAYYKGRWVIVPMFFVPEDAYDPLTGSLHRFRLEVLEGGPLPQPKKRESSKALKKKYQEAEACILPWNMDDKDLKEICKKFDIPFYWVTGRSETYSPKRRSEMLRRLENQERKNKPLSDAEYKKFRKELKKSSPEIVIICDILRYVNRIFSPATYITLEEVVRLQVVDITPQDSESNNSISFSRHNASGSHLLCTCLPSPLWSALSKSIRNDSIFVFTTMQGAPLSPSQVIRLIKNAAKRAGIKHGVSSLAFRPAVVEPSSKGAKNRFAYAKSTQYLHPVSEGEWDEMCRKIPLLKPKRGRKPANDQRAILNAILLKLERRGSIVSLPLSEISSETVKSQLRRWKKNGALDAIFTFRRLSEMG